MLYKERKSKETKAKEWKSIKISKIAADILYEDACPLYRLEALYIYIYIYIYVCVCVCVCVCVVRVVSEDLCVECLFTETFIPLARITF